MSVAVANMFSFSKSSHKPHEQRGVPTAMGAPSGNNRQNSEQPNELKQGGRRHFSVEEKLQILREADACSMPGELQNLLREKGIYHSHLSNWRKQLNQALHNALTPKKRGRPPKTKELYFLVRRISELEEEKKVLERRLSELEYLFGKEKK